MKQCDINRLNIKNSFISGGVLNVVDELGRQLTIREPELYISKLMCIDSKSENDFVEISGSRGPGSRLIITYVPDKDFLAELHHISFKKYTRDSTMMFRSSVKLQQIVGGISKLYGCELINSTFPEINVFIRGIQHEYRCLNLEISGFVVSLGFITYDNHSIEYPVISIYREIAEDEYIEEDSLPEDENDTNLYITTTNITAKGGMGYVVFCRKSTNTLPRVCRVSQLLSGLIQLLKEANIELLLRPLFYREEILVDDLLRHLEKISLGT